MRRYRAVQSAVHRALVAFTEQGLIHTLPAPGPPAFGLSDPPHHHAQCERCGTVTEIPVATLAGAVTVVQAALTFHVAEGGLSLRGLCVDCQQLDRGR